MEYNKKNVIRICNIMSKSFNENSKLRIYHILEIYDKKGANISENLIIELIEDMPKNQIYKTCDDTNIFYHIFKFDHNKVLYHILYDMKIDIYTEDNLELATVFSNNIFIDNYFKNKLIYKFSGYTKMLIQNCVVGSNLEGLNIILANYGYNKVENITGSMIYMAHFDNGVDDIINNFPKN